MKNESKVDQLFKKLSSIKLTTFQKKAAKNEATQSLESMLKHHSELIENIQQKLIYLQEKFNNVGTLCIEEQKIFKKKLSSPENLFQKNKRKVREELNIVHNNMVQKAKMQSRILKNKKESITSIHNQVKDEMSSILNIVYELQQKVMTSKMNTATTAKAIVKNQNKKLDQIIRQQEKQLQLIEQMQRKLLLQCDSLQKQVSCRLEGHQQKMENRRVKVYKKLQVLLQQIDIS